MATPKIEPKKEPQFFIRPGADQSRADVADELANFVISRANAWRREHGLPPMPTK